MERTEVFLFCCYEDCTFQEKEVIYTNFIILCCCFLSSSFILRVSLQYFCILVLFHAPCTVDFYPFTWRLIIIWMRKSSITRKNIVVSAVYIFSISVWNANTVNVAAWYFSFHLWKQDALCILLQWKTILIFQYFGYFLITPVNVRS